MDNMMTVGGASKQVRDVAMGFLAIDDRHSEMPQEIRQLAQDFTAASLGFTKEVVDRLQQEREANRQKVVQLKARITELEASSSQSTANPQVMEELERLKATNAQLEAKVAELQTKIDQGIVDPGQVIEEVGQLREANAQWEVKFTQAIEECDEARDQADRRGKRLAAAGLFVSPEKPKKSGTSDSSRSSFEPSGLGTPPRRSDGTEPLTPKSQKIIEQAREIAKLRKEPAASASERAWASAQNSGEMLRALGLEGVEASEATYGAFIKKLPDAMLGEIRGKIMEIRSNEKSGEKTDNFGKLKLMFQCVKKEQERRNAEAEEDFFA
jgi:cell division protein FtsB